METTLTVIDTSKQQKVVLRLLTILVFVWMLVIGVFKLIGTEPALVETFTEMHLLPVMPLVGVAEILGGIGLLVPRVRIAAAISLLFLFFGGLASHIASATYGMIPLTSIAMLMALCIIKLDGRLTVKL